eukprot:1868003-Rhodomonas_salina.1
MHEAWKRWRPGHGTAHSCTHRQQRPCTHTHRHSTSETMPCHTRHTDTQNTSARQTLLRREKRQRAEAGNQPCRRPACARGRSRNHPLPPPPRRAQGSRSNPAARSRWSSAGSGCPWCSTAVAAARSAPPLYKNESIRRQLPATARRERMKNQRARRESLRGTRSIEVQETGIVVCVVLEKVASRLLRERGAHV